MITRYLDELIAPCPECDSSCSVTLSDPAGELPPVIEFVCFDCFTQFEMTLAVPSPADQDCTPDGGVSANRADDNSTGGVTTPEVTWRASGSHSHGGADE